MLRRPIALLLSVILLASSAHADGWSDAKKFFAANSGADNHINERRKAVRSLLDFDSRAAAKLLIAAIKDSERTEAPLQAEITEMKEELDRLAGDKMFDEKRTFPQKDHDRYKVLTAKLVAF